VADSSAPVVALLGLVVPGLETSSGADARPGELKCWASARGSFLSGNGQCRIERREMWHGHDGYACGAEID